MVSISSRWRAPIGAGLVLAVAVLHAGCSRVRPAPDDTPPPQGEAESDRARHLLDPLTRGELQVAREVISSDPRWNANMTFPLVTLHEPPKAIVLASDGTPARREAFALVFDRVANATYEVVVNTSDRSIIRWEHKPGVQPNYSPEEFEIAEALVRADPRWRALAAQRGIRDLDNARIDIWGYGGETPDGARLVRGLTLARDGVENHYSRTVEGLIAIVNLNTRQVVSVSNTSNAPIPPGSEFSEDKLPALRTAPRPLQISQPEGPSFEIDGHLVRWQKWQFRWSLLPREGLVLHQVGYEDAGRVRPILYRASLAEASAAYGDPDPNWSWRNALDEGEYNMGILAVDLVPGKDVPENSVFFDAVFANDRGEPYVRSRAVALYEADDGLLWKHVDENQQEIRRARKLVLLYSAVVGNYDYVFQYIFRQDGTLEARVDLSGILLSKGAEASPYGTKVAPGTVAINHQHLISYRLDMDVDGPVNSVVETDVEALPIGPDNPAGNAFAARDEVITTEGARSAPHIGDRHWRVVNPNEINSLGQPTGYVLIPGAAHNLLAHPNSQIRSRTGFAHEGLWVTRQRDTELYASGPYTVQSSRSTGLPGYADEEPVESNDVVLWYTLNHTHIPRPEEWPVMPRTSIGFSIAPFGFFTQNPALDVPDTEPRSANR